jgi:hypothetical protein
MAEMEFYQQFWVVLSERLAGSFVVGASIELKPIAERALADNSDTLYVSGHLFQHKLSRDCLQ